MSDIADKNSTAPVLRTDGVQITAAVAPKTGTSGRKFWASGPRNATSTYRNNLEVSFGSKRIVNQISFKLSRFPLTCRVQYLDAKGKWQPVTYAQTTGKGRNRKVARTPVTVSITDSVPKKVNSSASTAHPQHWSNSHWVTENHKINPVTTSRIRLVIQRNPRGSPPVNALGRKCPYSVAVKDLVVGYRVLSPVDIPNTPPEVPWWASSTDLLGSRVVYSTYRQDASSAIDGSTNTYWRCEPQPFPFAVANLFLDVRDDAGVAPVVDRWWMDPVTVGPICNVYYSDSEPEGEYAGPSTTIPDQWRVEHGQPTVPTAGPEQTPLSLNFGPEFPCDIEVSNVYLRMRYDRPWWVGIDAQSLTTADDPDDRPLVTLGDIEILQSGGAMVVRHGEFSAGVTIDPALFGLNASYRLLAAYIPFDPATGRDAHFRIVLKIGDHEPTYTEIAIPALDDNEDPVLVGAGLGSDIPAFALKGLTVKSESLDADSEDWFFEEGADYVADPEFPSDERGTSINARLRLHPSFRSALTNTFGAVGGTGDRYGDMEWTPVTRDFTLRRGYLHIPPTRAKYWKFEMTRMLPQIYENFVTINRDVLVFPPDIVENFENLTAGPGSNTPPSGIGTVEGLSDQIAYRDALQGIRSLPASPDATDVLVIRDLGLAQQAANSGWIWTYQPWHIGSTAPQFVGTQTHRYESIDVNHNAKVAYFVGMRELMPFRVDYTFDDDTPEYVEHFLDQNFIEDSAGVEFFEGGVAATTTSSAEVTSKTFRSYRTVRGVQFASQETDSYQIMPDPDFKRDDLDLWTEYGDASLRLVDDGDIEVTRGWFGLTYGDIEENFDDYGSIDDTLYLDLEGALAGTGYAEGGFYSNAFSPSGSGKITVVAKISALESMTLPIRLEIIATATGQVVAYDEAYPQQGEVTQLEAGHSPGNLIEFLTYGDAETTYATYGDMDGVAYKDLESDELQTDLLVRIRQLGPSRDTFHVHRLALYESPVAWEFSNDNGATWWRAVDVRNNPNGVLLFPRIEDPDPTPEVGHSLKWRLRLYRDGAVVNALHIRPWYGSSSRTTLLAHSMESVGPNKSIYDNLPALADHPMWGVRPPPDDGAIGVGSSVTIEDESPVYGVGPYGGGIYGS